VQAEHARIDPLLDECTGAFARQAEQPSEGVRAALRRSLDDAWELLDGHLGHEERDAMTILQRHLTGADWQRVEREHFRPAYSPREVLAIVPWTMADLPRDVRRRLLAAGGPAIALLWRLTRRGSARRDAAAFGPPAVRQPELGQVHTADRVGFHASLTASVPGPGLCQGDSQMISVPGPVGTSGTQDDPGRREATGDQRGAVTGAGAGAACRAGLARPGPARRRWSGCR
jgi:hypothetical protein